MQQIQHKNVVALVDYIEDATFPQEHEVCFLLRTELERYQTNAVDFEYY